MRKIEKAMLEALATRRDWQQANTCVVFSDHIGNPYLDATIYLHGNQIAQLLPDGTIQADPDTFYKWPTRTTGSRLSALGIFNCTGNNATVYEQPIRVDFSTRDQYSAPTPTVQQQAIYTLRKRSA